MFLFSTSGLLANDSINRFLGQYCLDCHSADANEGEREFESFALPIQSQTQFIAADEIIDQLTLKVMPPQDYDQPSIEERLAIIAELRAAIMEARDVLRAATPRTVMRRLNQREYENTLAALFDRRVDTLGLTADFPKENTSHHMDTIGESLVTSGFLLDQYFQSASRLVERRLGKADLPPQSWHFDKNFRQYEELEGSHHSVFNFEYLCLYEQPNTDTRQGGYGHIEDFLGGVPVSGMYEIEVHAQAMHRDTHYDPKLFRIDFSEPFQLAVVPGDVTKGHIHYPQAIEPVLAEAIVPDGEPEWLTFQVWLEAGQTPRFIFPNGPYESRESVIKLNNQYASEFKKPEEGVGRATLLREGKLPHIRIDEIKIRGPLAEPAGTREEFAVFGEGGFRAEVAVDQLNAFAERAFRRPLDDADRKRIETLYQKRIEEQATPRQAALDTLKLILCSPAFLYLSEMTPEDESELAPFDLAARLSYALWAAPPDEELFSLARSGTLQDREVLKSQVHRMLADQRSDEFVRGFLDSWLNLRDIGNLPPPRNEMPDYYSENLPEAMKREAFEFFRHLLDENGSALDLLSSDYTFVDKRLAKLYQLPEQDSLRLADGFQKVSLAGNQQRGGVLGMAGVLTVSANGVDTSPVTRGVWVSENILGVTPPPPPDEVPAIDANTSGGKTIREKLALHSQDATCAVCHRNIDPLGFAMESFDPIGRWRDHYRKREGKGSEAEIDTKGTLPSGQSYDNFAGFKTVLLEHRREQFMHSLAEKLMSYSSGRHMQPTDRFAIEEVRSSAQSDNDGLRTMVVEVLTSETFRSR